MTDPNHSQQAFSAQASPNIALIKYWGNQDHGLRLPANNSLSMTLEGLRTTTTVTRDPTLTRDELTINGEAASNIARARASELATIIRELTRDTTFIHIDSVNNFPMGTGIASSASAFAALAQAACSAFKLAVDQPTLSRIARRASGSAARSVFAGYVELHAASREEDSFAESIFPPEHWELVDLIAVLRKEHKHVSSTEGHLLAETSALQDARISDTKHRITECKLALEQKDFERLARVVEVDSNMMHAVMMTSNPILLYWQPETVSIMHAIRNLRAEGLEVCYTIDAGPNVHCICTSSSLAPARARLESLNLVKQFFESGPGQGVQSL